MVINVYVEQMQNGRMAYVNVLMGLSQVLVEEDAIKLIIAVKTHQLSTEVVNVTKDLYCHQVK